MTTAEGMLTTLDPEFAHSVEGTDVVEQTGWTDEELEIIGLAERYHWAKIDTIRETYNSRFARSRNIFRGSKLGNFSERAKAKGKKMAFRSGTAFVLNYSADVLSVVPVTVPGAIVASTAAGAMGVGYDSFVNKQTSHRLWGYRTTQEFLTAKEALEPENLRGKKREYRDLVERLEDLDGYVNREDVEEDLRQVKRLVRSCEDGMIYNARSVVEIKTSSDRSASNKGWEGVDGLDSGLGYLYLKLRDLTEKLASFQTLDERKETLLTMLPSDVAKRGEELIDDVVDEKIRTLSARVRRRQNAMWVSETVASTALSLTGGILVGKWAERTFGWGKEVAAVTKSTLNQYFEYHRELFVENPVEFKATLSAVADTHIADQIDKVLTLEAGQLSPEEVNLKEFAEFKGITEGDQFREIFEAEYLTEADGESIKNFVAEVGNADLDTTAGARDFINVSGMDRFALDPEAKMPLAEVFATKGVDQNDELVALMKRNPRVFGNLDERYIGEIKYFDAVSRMPQTELENYMRSLEGINSDSYTADEAVRRLQEIADQSGVRYEERVVRVPLVETYRVASGDTVYGILQQNNIELTSPESVKFVSDNREKLLITASQFGNQDDLNTLLTKIDSGEITSLADDPALSGQALHWISTGEDFSIEVGFEEKVERVAVGAEPEWLKPVVRTTQETNTFPAEVAPREVTAQEVIDLRNSRIPDKITIPSINLDADVNEVQSLSSVDYPYISRTFAGHMVETGAMGYEDWPNKNMIIGGHVSYQGNPGVFFNLNKLQAGELIKITDISGNETFYKVSNMSVLHESEVGSKVSPQSNNEILTLITCQYGQNENKIVVVAEKFDPMAAKAANQERISTLRDEIAKVAQVFEFSSQAPERSRVVTSLADIKRVKEELLAKVA